MKSIKEKSKAYDEALERVKSVIEQNPLMEYLKKGIEYIFPELTESEDERIRKALIKIVNDHYSLFKEIDRAKTIAWLEKQAEHANFRNKIQIGDKVTRNKDGVLVNLSQLNRVAKKDEKQGEQNPNPCENCDIATNNCQNFPCAIRDGEQKPADKVEPKFHEGDFIKHNRANIIYKVISVNSGSYYLENIKTSGRIEIFNAERNFRLWTIQDAKDGDVLCCESGWTCIFKALDNHTNTFSSYCFMDKDKWFCNTGSGCHTLDKAFNGEIYPATKEQRDTLMKAMADAGYTFDFEKKELKKIEQKPAWSEEDATHYNRILKELNLQKEMPINVSVIEEVKSDIIWFKSLKDRVQPKQEWSEEDKKYENIIVSILYNPNSESMYNFHKVKRKDVIDWFKSLRPQNRWKPSDYQLEALDSATENCAYSEYQDCLRELIEQLKKLKE